MGTVTEYIYATNVVCLASHKSLGNALAAAIDPGTGGTQTFDKGLPCYSAGTTFSGVGPQRQASAQPAAYASFPLLKATGYAMVAEFNGDGPYPLMNGLGFSDQVIAAAKDVITLEVGPRAEIEPRGIAYVQSLGYVV